MMSDMTQYAMKIISGGQTGVDRAGLDAAMDRNYPVGGYCPKGRLAEDGSIPERYPHEEISGGYRARTRKMFRLATVHSSFIATNSGAAQH